MHQFDPSEDRDVTWVVTSQTSPWVVHRGPSVEAIAAMPDVIVQTDIPRQPTPRRPTSIARSWKQFAR